MDKNQNSKTAFMGHSGQSSRKRSRKVENPVRVAPNTEQCSDSRITNTWTCKNSACRAEISMVDTFCKRCSCCICSSFDDNKDPSLWLECMPDSPAASCGLSCHIECAFQQRKVGVVDLGQAIKLDGSYCCASCGKFSGILGYWKKQLTIAKDCRRIDSLCYRIYVCFRLFDGTLRFQDLHQMVKDAKNKLESEVGSLGGVSAKLARGLVSRLCVAAEVKALCAAAIQKADEVSAILSRTSLGKGGFINSMEIFNKNNAAVMVPQNEGTSGAKDPEPVTGNKVLQLTWVDGQGGLNDISGPVSSGVGQIVKPTASKSDRLLFTSIGLDLNTPDLSGGSASWAQHGPNEELPAVDSQAEVQRNRPASTEAHESASAPVPIFPVPAHRGSPENLGQFEYCVNVIRELERGKHIMKEFRQKMLTWLGVRANEQERRVVHSFIRALEDDPSSLAAQLVDTYTDIITNKP